MLTKFFDKNRDFGILIIRLGIGLAFVFVYGEMKIFAGPDFWKMLGGAMANLGINYAPVFWGLLSALAEFAGGILLTLGLFTRTTSFFMAFNMFVAAVSHFSVHDPWFKAITPVQFFAVFAGLIFIGAGKYSLDYFFFGRKKVKKEKIEENS
jgi:putative oxidoreductase